MPTGRCVIEGCDRRREARGWCKPHWQRWRRHGDPLAGNRPPVGGGCTIEGCTKPLTARGWCVMHWTRWQRNGDPLVAKPRTHTLTGPANAHWLPDQAVTYHGMHCRVKAVRGSASGYSCVDCGETAAHWSYDNADPDARIGPYRGRQATYSVKIDHYEPRCARCHKRFDRRAREARTRGLEILPDGSCRPLSVAVSDRNGQLVPEPVEAL